MSLSRKFLSELSEIATSFLPSVCLSRRVIDGKFGVTEGARGLKKVHSAEVRSPLGSRKSGRCILLILQVFGPHNEQIQILSPHHNSSISEVGRSGLTPSPGY